MTPIPDRYRASWMLKGRTSATTDATPRTPAQYPGKAGTVSAINAAPMRVTAAM